MKALARALPLLILVSCGLPPGKTVSTPSPSPAAPTTPAAPSGTFATRVLALTNAARAQGRDCGTVKYAATTPLTYSARLEQAAQAHAADMAAKNYFSHTSQDGRTLRERIDATGYRWSTIGENIAAGQASPEEVVQGWIASPGHCENLMNPAFRELGVGYTPASGGKYRTYWVQNFGAPR